METDTTRRYPRTLNEAFPGGTEYANAIERYRRTDTSGIVIVAVVAAPIVCALIGFWLGCFL